MCGRIVPDHKFFYISINKRGRGVCASARRRDAWNCAVKPAEQRADSGARGRITGGALGARHRGEGNHAEYSGRDHFI